MRKTYEIASDDPAFAGHFPGDPALPGIAQLALVARAAAELGAAAPFVRGVRKVKYREPVRPGARIVVELESIDGDETLRFAMWDEAARNEAISEGLLELSASRPDEPPRLEIPTRETPIRPAVIEEMLPHRGPALYMTDVLRASGASDEPCWFAGHVPADSFLVQDGRASSFATIEYACQTGAMTPELRGPAGGPVRALRGLLAGVKRATFAAPDFAVDSELVAAVRTTSRASFVNVHAEIATVRGGDARALATVELTILVR